MSNFAIIWDMRRTAGVLVFVFLILALAGVSPAFSATKAGTTIESAAELRFGGQVITTDVTTVEVAQMYGLTLTPTDSAGSITPEGTYYFPHRVENIGNGSDLVTFTLSNVTPEGWSGQLIVDENFNQIHDPGENTQVPTQVAIAEDAVYDFFLALTAPSTESTGEGTVTVTSEGNDGSGFYGANGIFYGGEDLVAATDTASVSAVAVSGLYIHRNDSTGDIYLTWEGGAVDVYYIVSSYESDFNSATVEAWNVTSPWTSSQISAQDGTIRYYRVTSAGTTNNFAPETVGKFDVSCEASFITESSLPLIPEDNSIQEVVGTQLTGGFNIATADKIKRHNPNNPSAPFDIAWLKSLDGKWYTGSQLTTLETGPDVGFEVEILSSHPNKYVTFVGRVSDTSRSIPILVGMNFVGSAYPIVVKLGDNLSQDSNLYESGATPGFNIPSADKFKRFNKDNPLSPFDIAWLKTGGDWYTGTQITTIEIEPGRGYWVEVLPTHSGFTWSYPKHYNNP